MEHLFCFFKILPSSMNNKQSLSRGPLPHPCLSSPCPCASCSQRPRFLHPRRPLSPVLLTVLLTGRCQVSSQGTLVHNTVLQSWSLDKTKRGRVCSKCRSDRDRAPHDNENTHRQMSHAVPQTFSLPQPPVSSLAVSQHTTVSSPLIV